MNYLFLALFSLSVFCLDDDVPILEFTNTTDSKYATASYKSSFKIQTTRFTFQSSEEKSSNPITNAFDGNLKSFWAANSENNETFKNHINISFSRAVNLDAIVLYPPYRTSGLTRSFDGFPLKLNVYSSENEEPLKLKTIFTGEEPTSKILESFLFKFEEPFRCKYLKIEYDNITKDVSFNSGRRVAAAADFDLFEGPIAEQVQFDGVEGNYSESNYVNERVIPPSKYICRSTGENEEHPLSYAFDDQTNTYFLFKDPNTEIFKNYLTFTFSQKLKIEAILYDSSYSTKGESRTFMGFPISLTLYASNGDEGFKPVYVFTGNPAYPHTRFQYVLPKPIECDKLRLEFSDVTAETFFSGGKKVPCIGNIYVLQYLDNDYFQINEEINGLFNDYAQFEMKEGIDSSKINELRERAKDFIVYENSLKPLLDRAEAVLKGSIKKDPHREFSTKPGSKHMITQYGDIAGHCRKDLLFNSFGTNRQVIGIGGTGNRPIVCYVDVEPLEGVPKSAVRLPTLTFCQSIGTWQCSFIGAQLHLGRNAFKFPNFLELDSYRGANLVAGGPIHVNNPYTLEEQKGHVTLYFEQGYVYPVFRSGDDEETFKIILKDYYNRLNDPNDEEITVTVFEAFSNHVITSAKTELAYNYYINNGFSPQSNVDRWDDFLGILLDFAGVPFDKNDPKYHPLNEYVKQNFRAVQPYAGFFAFASSEMIGLPMESTHGHLAYLSVPGWAIAHEFGHTVDKKGRIWGENTNNMWSLCNLFRIEKNIYDRVPISSVSKHLSSDFSPYVTHEDGLIEMTNNPCVWWIIEGGCPGYWSTSENLFVYETSDKNEDGNTILCITERFIYYASLATKKNLSCYFERFGFWFPGEHRFNSAQDFWTYQNSTDEFRSLMNQALQENRFVDECPKYWYVDLNHYSVLNRHNNKLGEWSTCYSQNDIIYPTLITKYDTYYFINLPEIKNTEAHLCYEVQSFIDNKWQVVGATYNTFFQDDYPYDKDFTPKYRIIGYDRSFHTSGIPPEREDEIQTTDNVFRINSTYFSSLQNAINAIETDNDIIYVMKSVVTSPVIFNKTTIRIMPDPELTEPVTIMKLVGGNLFNVNGCRNLHIGSSDTVQLIIDGNNFKNKGNIISSGVNSMNFYNCLIKNSINTDGEGKGGAIYVSYGTACSLYNTIIEKCSGAQGGAIHLQGGGSARLSIYNSTIRNCFASNEGGAIYASTFQGYCQILITQNSIIENNEATNRGGAIYFMIQCSIFDSFIRNNKAGKEGSAVYYHYDNYNNALQIDHTVVENNDEKSAIYLTPRTHLKMNGCSISGIIYKTELAKISLARSSGVIKLPDFTKTTFSLDLPNGGTVLILNTDEANYKVAEIIDDIHVLNGYATQNGTAITAYPNKCTITINFNGQKITKEFSHGIFTFSETFEGISEDYYITSWSLGDTIYNIGDQILINQDMEFTINTLMYYKVTLNYGSETQIIRVTQNYIYYLPITTPSGERLFGFNCVTNGKYYAYAEPVEIVSDMTFNAVIVQMHTLTIIAGSETTTLSKKYGDEYTLPQPPEEYDGKIFKYWLIGDVQYQPKDVITVNADMTITAFYSDTLTITFIIGEKEHSTEHRHNDKIVLHYPGRELVSVGEEEEETGRDFDYWLIDGEVYLLYSTYTVTKNADIVAHYTQINRDQKITVSYEILQVNASNFANGTKLVTQSFDYLSNMSFPEGNSFGDFGYDPETGREIIFSHWDFNGQRFNAPDSVGVTTPFTVVAATELSENVMPNATAMATPTESPTQSEIPATPSELPPATPYPTDPKIEADVINYIELDNNKAQISFDCSVIQGYIKVFLECETCTKVNSGIWFKAYIEDYQVSNTEYDDRKITVQDGNEVDVSSFISDIKLDSANNYMTFNKGTSMLKLTHNSEHSLKCYVPPSSTPMQTPVPPDQTPIPPEPTPAQTPFVVKDLSHSQHSGEIDAIILNDDYPYTEVIDAQFTECTLKQGGDYLITVQKAIKFKDVDFTRLQIGAIKIDSNDVVIDNCKFIECSSNTGNGNAIYVSSSFESSTNTIKYCTFESCGEEGYAIVSLDSITFSNNVIDAKNQNGGILVKNINAKILHCSFSNTYESKAIYYDQLDTTLQSRVFAIKNCTFTHCLDCCLYFGILENTPDEVVISDSKFIECYATSNDDYSQSNVISVKEEADSYSLKVEGCQFKNCGTIGYVISIVNNQMVSSYYDVPIRFSNSKFEFDKTESCCAIKIAQTCRKVEVYKCEFKRCSPNIKTEQYVSCIYAYKPIELNVEESTFVGCGSISFGGTAIAVDPYQEYRGCTVKKCTFNLLEEGDVEYPCDGAVTSYSEHLTLIGNNFIECSSFAIQIMFKSLESSTFRMIENTFEKCRTTLVSTSDGSFTTTPEIKGNTFKEISITTQLFLFVIQYYSSTIKFESNTFNKVSTSYGGFGGKITFANSINDTPLSLVFTNCNFIENSQDMKGGAFQSNEIQNGLDASLTFKSCNFISNKAKSLGGALYIDYDHDITIEGCEFKGNKAGDGQGSAIYIADKKQRTSKVKISKCNFADNDDFEENKYDGFAIISSSHQIEITECNIKYSNEETAISGLKVESSNTFTMSKCTLVRCGGTYEVSFVIYSQNPIVFTDNTIEYGKNIGAIILADEVKEQSIVNSNFNNNTYSSIGAATSILIKHENDEADNLKVKINKCKFANNMILPGSGGALYLDEDKVGFDIIECTFSENHATRDGGALCIKRASSIHVENTKFLNNKCSKRGGAIYIDFDDKTEASKLSDENYCSISSSTFQKNIAGLNGNGIFVNDDRSNAKYAISDNKFVNNYKDMLSSGYVIVSKSIDLNVQTVNEFSNTNENIKVYPYINLLKDNMPDEFNQPFKTPEPLETEKIEHNSEFIIDTSGLKDNIEYVADLVYDSVKIVGEGSKNLYLQFGSNTADIEKTDADFGVILDSNSSKSIKIHQKEIALNVKGNGMLNIEKETENDKSNSLGINDVIVSHEENIVLNVVNELETFQMNNLNLYGDSSFDIISHKIKETPEVKSAMVHEGARAQINNLEVKEKLEIAVDAVINLFKVKLSKAKLVINYSPDKQRSMPLSGILSDPPTSISLKKSEREMVKDDDEKKPEARLLEESKFYIASASPNEFSNCEDWANKVDFDGSDYNKAKCQVEDGNMVLYAAAGEPDGDGGDKGKSGKNNLPIIIGAAAGGVVLIVVIIVIVVVVVKRKKSKENSDKFQETLNTSFDFDLDI